MPDVRLVQNTFFPQYDVSLDWSLRDDGMLDDRQALATAVIVALGTDRLAERDDVLPDPDSTDRRGWWGDLEAREVWGGWPIGSRLWLLERDKIEDVGSQRGSTTTRVEYYIREAVQPFLDLRLASAMDVRATRVGRDEIEALVRLYRGPQLAVELRYQVLWQEMIEGA